KKREKLICDAAVAVFAREGYGKASVSEIIREANMARGTFYLYYKNKGEIFDAILERFLTDVARAVSQNQEEPETRLSPAELFRSLSRELGQAMIQNRLVARIILSESERLDLFMDRLSSLIANYLHEASSRGEIRDCRADIVARCLVGGLKEIVSQTLLKDSLEMEAALVSCVDFFLSGLARPQISFGQTLPEGASQILPSRPPFSDLH
ncbi:MAG: TetR/AcrR family transcriptional regulator, partial [Deltaproteobacteria bacterium]|nr:TetR/AcrR family transcriptional regulator [Deltaproteobacteria bacterium]